MAGQIVCARCGKILSGWDLSQGHECDRFYFGRWEIREEETVLWNPDQTEDEETAVAEDDHLERLQECPFCHKVSLGFNTILLLWECLNTSCRARVANDDLDASGKVPR